MDADEFEYYTDTDQGNTNETCSNYSEQAEFTVNTEDSESESTSSVPLKRSAVAHKHNPVKGKVTSEDTLVSPHSENQDNTVEDVEISGTSNRKKSRKVKVASMRGKESQEPPVTSQREESNVENVPGTNTATFSFQAK